MSFEIRNDEPLPRNPELMGSREIYSVLRETGSCYVQADVRQSTIIVDDMVLIGKEDYGVDTNIYNFVAEGITHPGNTQITAEQSAALSAKLWCIPEQQESNKARSFQNLIVLKYIVYGNQQDDMPIAALPEFIKELTKMVEERRIRTRFLAIGEMPWRVRPPSAEAMAEHPELSLEKLTKEYIQALTKPFAGSRDGLFQAIAESVHIDQYGNVASHDKKPGFQVAPSKSQLRNFQN
jgi:hypothetical protein